MEVQKKRKVSWNTKVALLTQYREKHGTAVVPVRYIDPESGFRLGGWVRHLRLTKSRLTAWQVELLEQMGFAWNATKEWPWETKLEALKRFNQKHAHYRVPRLYVDEVSGFKLGQWVPSLRRKNATLKASRKCDLITIGFFTGNEMQDNEDVDEQGEAGGGEEELQGCKQEDNVNRHEEHLHLQVDENNNIVNVCVESSSSINGDNNNKMRDIVGAACGSGAVMMGNIGVSGVVLVDGGSASSDGDSNNNDSMDFASNKNTPTLRFVGECADEIVDAGGGGAVMMGNIGVGGVVLVDGGSASDGDSNNNDSMDFASNNNTTTLRFGGECVDENEKKNEDEKKDANKKKDEDDNTASRIVGEYMDEKDEDEKNEGKSKDENDNSIIRNIVEYMDERNEAEKDEDGNTASMIVGEDVDDDAGSQILEEECADENDDTEKEDEDDHPTASRIVGEYNMDNKKDENDKDEMDEYEMDEYETDEDETYTDETEEHDKNEHKKKDEDDRTTSTIVGEYPDDKNEEEKDDDNSTVISMVGEYIMTKDEDEMNDDEEEDEDGITETTILGDGIKENDEEEKGEDYGEYMDEQEKEDENDECDITMSTMSRIVGEYMDKKEEDEKDEDDNTASRILEPVSASTPSKLKRSIRVMDGKQHAARVSSVQNRVAASNRRVSGRLLQKAKQQVKQASNGTTPRKNNTSSSSSRTPKSSSPPKRFASSLTLTKFQIPIMSTRSRLSGGVVKFRESNEAYQFYAKTCNAVADAILSGTMDSPPADIALDLLKREFRQYSLIRCVPPKKHRSVNWNLEAAEWEVLDKNEAIRFVAQAISSRVSVARNGKERKFVNPAFVNSPMMCGRKQVMHAVSFTKSLKQRQIPIVHRDCSGFCSIRKTNEAYLFFQETCQTVVNDILSRNSAFSATEVAVGLLARDLRGYSVLRSIRPKFGIDWSVKTTQWEVLGEREVIRFVAHAIMGKFNWAKMRGKQAGREKRISSSIEERARARRCGRLLFSPNRKHQECVRLDLQHHIPITSSKGAVELRLRSNGYKLWLSLLRQAVVSNRPDAADILKRIRTKGYDFVRGHDPQNKKEWHVNNSVWKIMTDLDIHEFMSKTVHRILCCWGKKKSAEENENFPSRLRKVGCGKQKNRTKVHKGPSAISKKHSGTLHDRQIPVFCNNFLGGKSLRSENKAAVFFSQVCDASVRNFDSKKCSLRDSARNLLQKELCGYSLVSAVPLADRGCWSVKTTRWVEMDEKAATLHLTRVLGTKLLKIRNATQKNTSFSKGLKSNKEKGRLASPVNDRKRRKSSAGNARLSPDRTDTKRIKLNREMSSSSPEKKLPTQQKLRGAEKSVLRFNPLCGNHIPKINHTWVGAKGLHEQSSGQKKFAELCNRAAQKCVDLHKNILTSGQSPVVSHKETALRILPEFSGCTFFRAEKKKHSTEKRNVENACWKKMDKEEILDHLIVNITSRYGQAVKNLRTSVRKEGKRKQRIEQFQYLLDRAAKISWRVSMEEKEAGFTVRRANFFSKINGCWAPYGRMLPLATDRILRDVLQLNRGDTFVDMGHGLGNAVLQAAYTVGCESRGIELVDDRFTLSEELRDGFEVILRSLPSKRKVYMSSRGLKKGQVHLVHGGLEMKEYRDFVSCASGGGVIKAFADNFNGVFADRCSTGEKVWLDHSIAGLFAIMPPGSKLVTLHELSMIPPRSVANAERVNRKNLTESTEASFYELEKVVLGKANECLSWSSNGSNDQDVILYVYTRLLQKSPWAVFLCSNPTCESSKPENALCATKTMIDKDGIEKLVLNTLCPNCSQNLRPSRSTIIREEN